MFLDDTRHIVVYIRTYNKTILSLASHSLCIDVYKRQSVLTNVLKFFMLKSTATNSSRVQWKRLPVL